MRPRTRAILTIVLTLELISLGALAGQTVMISQKKRTFSPSSVELQAGDTLHIANDDEFTHQVYVDSDSFKFESPETDPGGSIDVTFPTPGTYDVHCHIHPKMRLHVIVQ